MPPLFSSDYCVDLVLLLDLSGDKIDFLGRLTDFLADAETVFESFFSECGKSLHGLRVRVVGFRDPNTGENFVESRFFALPDEAEELCAFVRGLRAFGPSGNRESFEEAVERAFSSDFVGEQDGVRAIRTVAIFSDSPFGFESTLPERLKPIADSYTPKLGQGFSFLPYRYITYMPESPEWLDSLPVNIFKSAAVPVESFGELREVDFSGLVEFICF